MARKTTPAPVRKEVPADLALISEATASANTLALALTQQDERVTALAKKLNYKGSTDVSVLENSAGDAIRRMGMTVFELGAYLLLLREACPHGKFLPVLERLNIEPRAAQRYMGVTRRFANTSTSSHFESAGLNKMVELLPLDDEQLDQLSEFGQTGELELDKVATMSIKDLRAAVRELRQDKDASEKLLEKKNAKIDQLSRRIAKMPPDEVFAELQKEATGAAADASGSIQGYLRQAVIKIREHAAAHDMGPEKHEIFVAGLVGQVQGYLTALRQEFDLPDVSNAAEQQLAADVARWAPPKKVQ